MAGKTFQFRLITPLGKLLDTQAESVQFPAHDGLVGILANRAPLVMKLGHGALRVDFGGPGANGGSKVFYIEDGFAQMVANKLTVLTTKATGSEDLTEASVQAELTQMAGRPAAERGEAARQRESLTKLKSKLAVAKSLRGKGI